MATAVAPGPFSQYLTQCYPKAINLDFYLPYFVAKIVPMKTSIIAKGRLIDQR